MPSQNKNKFCGSLKQKRSGFKVFSQTFCDNLGLVTSTVSVFLCFCLPLSMCVLVYTCCFPLKYRASANSSFLSNYLHLISHQHLAFKSCLLLFQLSPDCCSTWYLWPYLIRTNLFCILLVYLCVF